MITVRKDELEKMVASAEATLMLKALDANEQLKRGEDIANVQLSVNVAHSNLLALQNYDTVEYDPAEFYNLLDPMSVSKIYSNTNTLNK